MIEPVILIVLALLFGLITFVLLQFRNTKLPPRSKAKRRPVVEEKRRPCPLCGTALRKGETVKTVVYPAKGDTLAEVFGCPYCYGERATAVRSCPVCKKPIPDGGHVVGRMFKEGRHLHVLGCTRCRRT